MTLSGFWRIGSWVALVMVAGLRIASPQAATSDKPSPATVAELGAQIDRRYAELEQEGGLDDATRNGALARLTEARAHLAQATADIEATEAIAAERSAAPELQLAAAAALAELQEPRLPQASATLSDAELRIAADEAAVEADAASTRRLALEEQRATLRASRPLIGPALAEARAALAAVRDTQTQIRTASQTRPGTRTSLPRALAEEQALLARIALLEEQRAGLDVRERLMTTRLEVARQTAAIAAARAEMLRQEYSQRLRSELEGAATPASAELFARHPQLKELAAANAALLEAHPAGRRAEQLASVRAELAAVDRQIADLEAESSYTTRTLESLGRSYAAGQILTAALRDLQRNERHRAALQRRVELIEASQVELVSLSRERLRLARQLEALPGVDIAAPASPTADVEAQAMAQSLIAMRLELLDITIQSIEDYVGALTEVQARERMLAQRLDHYETDLVSRQSWVPNVEPMRLRDMRGAVRGLATLADAQLWRALPQALASWLRSETAQTGLAIAAMILALALGHRARRAIPGLASRALSGGLLRSIFSGVVPAFLAAGALAAGTWLAGWLLGSAPGAPPGAVSLGFGLRRIAIGIFLIVAVQLLYSTRGALLRRRPDWSHGAAAVRRANLRIAGVLGLLVACLVLFEAHVAGIGTDADIAARLCLILAALVIASALGTALRPGRGVIAIGNQGRRLRWVYGLALVLPVLLAAAVLRGYVLATYQTSRAMLATLGLLAIAAAVRAIATMDRPAPAAETPASEHELAHRRDRLVSIVLVIVLGFALVWIWRDVLTALTYLQEITLWTTEGADGLEAITVANVLSFLLTLAGTLVVFWALPVIAGTQGLGTSQAVVGTRYAVITLLRYLVLVVGVFVGFSLLDIGWSKLQWLAAGLSVGLGFGLQESVANFVAGLMLLSEGQVRAGDLITAGDKTGVVSRIQMRATTVKDFDGREVIIPNKELVTTQVTNWTLSDSNRRIQIVVGVAYGSDTDLVEKLLLEAARSVPWVMRDPPPRVVFELFGESSLQFRLYVWIAAGDRVLDTVHDLHRGIERSFRDRGVGISFPQRDVHLDAAGPLAVQLVAAPARSGDGD